MQQYVCIDFEDIFDYTKSFESDGDMKNMFCSNFHFKLKRNLDDESDEEIDDIDDLFYSPYKKRKLDEEEDTASTIVAVTANITLVISRTKKRAPQILFETKSGGIDAIATLLVRSLKSKSEFSTKRLI